MSATADNGYPHGTVQEEAALLADALEQWLRSAKGTVGPLLTAALGAATTRAAGFAPTGAAAGGTSQAGAGEGAGSPGGASGAEGLGLGLGLEGECRFCPLCRLLAALRGPRSEVMDHLLDASTALMAAMRAAVAAGDRSWVGGASGPVERIDIL